MEKRICIVSAQYLPSGGGVEHYTYYLARELVRQGAQVTVVTSLRPGLPAHEAAPEGFRVLRLPSFLLMKGRYPVLHRSKAFAAAEKELRQEHFSLMLIQTRFYPISLWGARFAKRNSIRCITLEHGTAHLTAGSPPADAVIRLQEHLITALQKRACTEYMGVSLAAAQWSAHFGITSRGVLYNSIDPEEFRRLADRKAVDFSQYGIPPSARVIAFTGRLNPEKGIQELCRAFSCLGKEDTWLLIAGEGPLRKPLEALAIPRALFLGQLNREQIAALLARADIFCLPSVSEGLSTSVLEAVAAKAFVITTARGGSKELVAPDGIILPDNAPEGIRQALLQALDRPEECQRMAEQAFLRLTEHFTWKETAAKVLAL